MLVLGLRPDHHLVETRWQAVDQIDIVGELLVLLDRHLARNEDPEVPDRLVNTVDDGLTVRADVIDIFIKIEDPIERLRRRGNIVSPGTEAHDGGFDVAQIDPHALRGHDLGGGELVPHEELVDDVLHLLPVKGRCTVHHFSKPR